VLNPKKILPFKTQIRTGIASMEIVVACTLLVAVIGTSAALMVRIRAIGVDAEYRSIALQEIANELESRLAQNADELSKLPVEWKPSVSLLHRWPDSVLRYKEIRDELGVRGTVTFLRTTSPASEPIELSGWIATKQGDAP
jgi:hypothetical protein